MTVVSPFKDLESAELRDPDIAMDTYRNSLKTFLFDMQL